MGISRAASFAVALVFSFAVATSPAPAAPQGPWVPPQVDLSSPGRDAYYPQIAIAPDGTTTAVWYRDDGSKDIIQAATRPQGGSFGAPVDLSASGQNAFDPQIAIAPDGTATTVWRRYNGSNYIIQAATRPPGGSFGAPVDLSANGQNAYFPQIAIAPDGTATAVWSRSDGTNDIIQSATRPPGGSFGPGVDLSGAGRDALDPQIAVALDGTATTVWRRFDGSNSIIQSATRPPGGTFGLPLDLSGAGQSAYGPQIAVAPDHTVTAIWERSDGTNNIIQATARPPGGSFGAPVDLSAVGHDAEVPQIATAPDGTATAVWLRYDSSFNDIIQAATHPPGGSFGVSVDLSASGQIAGAPEIATAPDGTATAVWERSDGSKYIIQAATRPPGGSFGFPVNLSAAGQSALDPQTAVAPDGTANAVWSRFNGSNDIIQTISTAQPSPLLSVSKPGSGSGMVTSTPAGIDCGKDCSENYLSFTKVTLTARSGQGSEFRGWGKACKGAVGNTCELIVLDDVNAAATFGKPRLRVKRVKPKKPKVRRGKKVKLKVTAKNSGDATAKGAKLCLKLSKGVKKKLKPKGKSCRKLGKLAPGKAKTRRFRLKATGKAKRGKKYKVKFKLSAKGAKTAVRAVKVRVK